MQYVEGRRRDPINLIGQWVLGISRGFVLGVPLNFYFLYFFTDLRSNSNFYLHNIFYKLSQFIYKSVTKISTKYFKNSSRT